MPLCTISFEVSEADAGRFAQGDLMVFPVTDLQAQFVGQTIVETGLFLSDLAAISSTDGMASEQAICAIGLSGSLSNNFNAKGKVTAKVTDPKAVIAQSLSAASAGMLPIDFAHGMDDLGAKDGRAAGWITNLSVEGDKIMGEVEWTVAGRDALKAKEYRFISPTFYLTADGKEVTHIARAGLTNIPALPELKQVASAQDAPPLDTRVAALAAKLNMPAETSNGDVLAAVEAAIDQWIDARKAQPATAAALVPVADADALSKVLASALDPPETATSDEIVTALLTRQTGAAETPATGQPDQRALIPITAVADYMASSAEQRHADLVDTKVTAAMQAGRLPPALEAWGRDLCRDKPDEFDRFLKSSPFDLSNNLKLNGPPPVSASALAPTLDPADAITAQLGLPKGSLRT